MKDNKWKYYKCKNCKFKSGSCIGEPNKEHNCKDFPNEYKDGYNQAIDDVLKLDESPTGKRMMDLNNETYFICKLNKLKQLKEKKENETKS